MDWRRNGLAVTLLATYLAFWGWLAIDPLDRPDWFLENLLVFVTLPLVILYQWKVRFSNLSLASLFLFYGLHAVGSHWSYSNVPLTDDLFGDGRNHYDRIVHLAFGLLIVGPLRDVLLHFAHVGRRAAMVFAFCVLMTASASYEVIEWGAMAVVAPDLGLAFVGAQGDEFDASKDMGLAAAGGLLAIATGVVVGVVRGRRTRGRPRMVASGFTTTSSPRPPRPRP